MGPNRRARVFLAHNGVCGRCTVKITGPYEIDHILALALGGPDIDANCHPLCEGCHAPKTKDDVRKIAKVRRLIRASDPATRRIVKRKIMGRGFDKGLSKRFDGSVVERETR